MATRVLYHRTGKRSGAIDYSRATPVAVGSIAEANRHTGKPHEHRREISRRRQQAGLRVLPAVLPA